MSRSEIVGSVGGLRIGLVLVRVPVLLPFSDAERGHLLVKKYFSYSSVCDGFRVGKVRASNCCAMYIDEAARHRSDSDSRSRVLVQIAIRSVYDFNLYMCYYINNRTSVYLCWIQYKLWPLFLALGLLYAAYDVP
jgi:hypothetical protein